MRTKLLPSCLTLCNHMTAACQAPLSMGILQARTLEWVAMPSSRGSSQPRDQTCVSYLALGVQSSGASASASALLVNSQGWFPLRLTSLVSYI